MAYAKKKKYTSSGEPVKVQDIVVDRLIAKIQEEGKMPWHQPFKAASMNWYTEIEYRGINRVLLTGGEYITKKQLEEYNKKNDTSFWFVKGSKTEIVTFFTTYRKRINESLLEKIKREDPNNWQRYIFKDEKGYFINKWTLKYYRVFNIRYIEDKEGNKLEPKMGKTIFENHTPADEMVQNYRDKQGVGLEHGYSGASYSIPYDKVKMPNAENFDNSEAYYRTLFHEMIHSTGHKKRLARKTLENYHDTDEIRGKEEFIAEIGGLLLASEAGFTIEDNYQVDNSLNYVAGWCDWMKDNPNEVVNGLYNAEKAKNYFLTGGEESNGADKDIDSGKGEVDPTDSDINDALTPDESSNNSSTIESSNTQDESSNNTSEGTESTESTESDKPLPFKDEVKAIRSKKGVREFYEKNLAVLYSDSLSAEEKEAILKRITLNDIKKLYFVLTKEKLTSRSKAQALEKLTESLSI